MPTPFQFNDGGRAAAGYRGKAKGDCGARALAIVAQMSYVEACALVNEYAEQERPRGKNKRSNAQTGVWVDTMKKILRDLGFIWTPTMGIGTGCTIHLTASELPAGRLLVRTSRHYTSMVNGVIQDAYDPSREGKRCVYGYWRKV